MYRGNGLDDHCGYVEQDKQDNEAIDDLVPLAVAQLGMQQYIGFTLNGMVQVRHRMNIQKLLKL